MKSVSYKCRALFLGRVSSPQQRMEIKGDLHAQNSKVLVQRRRWKPDMRPVLRSGRPPPCQSHTKNPTPLTTHAERIQRECGQKLSRTGPQRENCDSRFLALTRNFFGISFQVASGNFHPLVLTGQGSRSYCSERKMTSLFLDAVSLILQIL